MKILCATDLQPQSANALSRAAWLARKLKGELAVLHVVSPDEPRGLALEQRVWRAESHARATLPPDASGATIRIRVGNPVRRIVEHAREISADMVVLGPHGVAGGTAGISRSIADRVLAGARLPVLIVRQAPQFEYARSLLAVDLSSESVAALKLCEALSFAGEEITFAVHAYQPPYEGMLASVGVAMDKLHLHANAWRENFETGVRAFLRKHSRDPWRYRLILTEDRPASGILSVAARIQPDLLVLGSRGQGPVLHALLGSVGSRVADEAETDVLLVPASEPPGPAAA
jgi:nucleotide-binding universal stress UspA family protein